MASPNPSRMIIQHYEGLKGNFLDSQYLGAAYKGGKPHEFEGTLMKIYSSSTYFNGKLLTAQGITSNSVKEIDNEVYRWTMQGAEETAARVIENLEASNTAIGLANTTFRVKLDHDFYREPDVMMGEDNSFPCEILGDGVPDGIGTVKCMRLLLVTIVE